MDEETVGRRNKGGMEMGRTGFGSLHRRVRAAGIHVERPGFVGKRRVPQCQSQCQSPSHYLYRGVNTSTVVKVEEVLAVAVTVTVALLGDEVFRLFYSTRRS